jgi:hypothetical protein
MSTPKAPARQVVRRVMFVAHWRRIKNMEFPPTPEGGQPPRLRFPLCGVSPPVALGGLPCHVAPDRMEWRSL